MKKTSAILLVTLMGLFALFCVACEDAEDDEPSLQEWIDKGLYYLGQGEGADAYLAFKQALLIDKGNIDAKYGVVMADVLQLEDTLALLFGALAGDGETYTAEQIGDFCGVLDGCDLLEQLGADLDQCTALAPFGLPAENVDCTIAHAGNCDAVVACLQDFAPAPEEVCEAACMKMDSCNLLDDVELTVAGCTEACPRLYSASQLGCYLAGGSCDQSMADCFPPNGSSLQQLGQDFFEGVALEMVQKSEDAILAPDWSFFVPSFEFSLIPEVIEPVLSGENDRSDAFMLHGISIGFAGLLDIVFALDLDYNQILLGTMLQAIGSLSIEELFVMEPDQLQATLIEIRGGLDLLLHDPVYAQFLSLSETDGRERVRNASEEIGTVFGDLADMIDSVNFEEDPQWDDAIRYVDTNENGAWDNDESLLIPGVLSMDKELAYAWRAVLLELQYNFVDGRPFALNTINDVLAHYDVPVVSAILDVLYVLGYGEVDFSYGLRNPDEDGVRQVVEDVIRVLDIVIEAIDLIEQ